MRECLGHVGSMTVSGHVFNPVTGSRGDVMTGPLVIFLCATFTGALVLNIARFGLGPTDKDGE